MDGNKIFGVALFFAIITVVMISLAYCLVRNVRMSKQKKNGQVVEAEILSWKAILGQPTRYAFRLTYCVGDENIVKILITSGRFAKKYEHKDRVQIVILPNSQKVCFQEETWLEQNICLVIALTVLSVVLAGLGFFAVIGALAFSEARSVPVKYAVKEEDFQKYGDFILVKEVHYTGTGWSIVGDENGYFPEDEIQDVMLVGEEQLPGARMPENYNVFLCTAEYKGMVEHVAFENEVPCYEITEWNQWHPIYPIVRTDRLLPQDWYPRDYMTENDVPYY